MHSQPLPRRRTRPLAPPRPRAGRPVRETRRIDRSIVLVASVALITALAFLAWVTADALLLVFAGVLLAVFLRGLADILGKLAGLGRNWSLALTLLLLAAVITLAGLYLGAQIAEQLDELGPRLQATWAQARDLVHRYEWGRSLLDARPIGDLSPDKADWLAHITGGLFSTAAGAIAGLLVTLFIGIYAAAAPRVYRNGLLHLVPARYRQRIAEVLDKAGGALRGWLLGTLVKRAGVGVAATVGLSLLGIPLALALGLIAFLLEFVPYLGPFIGAVPAVLVALAAGPGDAAYVVLLYLGIHAAEGYVIAPLVDQRSVHLPPALGLVAQLLLGTLFGFLGLIFAVPLAAFGMVLVQMLYVEDFLGERPGEQTMGAPFAAPRGPSRRNRYARSTHQR
jgi:predicted PurR-regulated permease PerM